MAGQLGFARQWGWKPPSHSSTANTGGGMTYNPKLKFKPVPASPAAAIFDTGGGPPAGSFNPEVEAKRRAAQRGLEDTLSDTTTERHFTTHDLHRAMTKIRTDTSRKRQQIGIESERGGQKISNEEADAKQSAQRQQEDFTTKRAEIGRQFADLGHRQAEAANQAGVNDAGTSAASAAARSRNQGIAEAPIATAEGRLQQDLATSLQRLAQSRGYLSQDTGIARSQLKQDRDWNRQQAKTEAGRKLFGYDRTEQRALREGTATNADLLAQEIYDARLEHPGAYQHWKANRKKGGK